MRYNRKLLTAFLAALLLLMIPLSAMAQTTPPNIRARQNARARVARSTLGSGGDIGKSEDDIDDGTYEDIDPQQKPEDNEFEDLEGGDIAGSDIGNYDETGEYDETGDIKETGNEEIGEVTLPDWWTEASKVFKHGDNARVLDVRTGLSYNIKRMGGTNHADTEPLTARDTAIMRQIYGGSWSWDRRAIIVSVNGKFYAASQNGMPHGQQTVYDNNYDGQFCIHFKNSRTHGGNKVCPLHKAAMEDAYAAYN